MLMAKQSITIRLTHKYALRIVLRKLKKITWTLLQHESLDISTVTKVIKINTNNFYFLLKWNKRDGIYPEILRKPRKQQPASQPTNKLMNYIKWQFWGTMVIAPWKAVNPRRRETCEKRLPKLTDSRFPCCGVRRSKAKHRGPSQWERLLLKTKIIQELEGNF